jgi:hypothetical protein
MRFFFGFLALLAAIVVVILLVLGIVKSFNATNKPVVSVSSYTLNDDKALDGVARYTVSGPVVADENYRQIIVTISKNTRSVEVLKGYSKTQEKVATLPNSPAAFKAFLGALDAAQFTSKRDIATSADPRSICVSGNKYFYEFALGSDKKVDTWTSSCSFRNGTFAGNSEGTAQIFKSQIPNYGDITNGVNLYSL